MDFKIEISSDTITLIAKLMIIYNLGFSEVIEMLIKDDAKQYGLIEARDN